MTKLDEIALNIELVLISIVEGVALVTLGDHATDVLQGPQALYLAPFVLAGLLLLLVFWAQSILHAISFIRWPLKMEHMFLYFVAAFVQVIAYGCITDAKAWFFWWTIFSLVALATYVVDLRIMKESPLARDPTHANYIQEIVTRHLFEMKYLVPVAIAFNLLAYAIVTYTPPTAMDTLTLAALGILQSLISLIALLDCVRNFNKRSHLLPAHFE